MKKIHWLYAGFWILSIVLALGMHRMPAAQLDDGKRQPENLFIKAKIEKTEGSVYTLRAVGGQKTFKSEIDDYFIRDDYEKGDVVSVYVTKAEDGASRFDVADYYHLDGLILIFLLFCGTAILVARKKGLLSILSVIVSLVFFYALILNSFKVGLPVIWAGVLYVFVITLLTIPMIHGFNRKSLSAILSVNVGYAVGFALTYAFAGLAQIGKTPSEEFRTLKAQFPDLDVGQIMIMSLFLGTVGALIDVAISICSAVFEGLQEHPNLTFSKTYTIGMSIGKDILGSMVNTLLMAYLAGSAPFLILLSLSRFDNPQELLNYDFVALEMARIFVGAVSIVLLIPVTSVIAAHMLARKGLESK
jgi:uncharacterized membrane protein